MTLAAPLWLWLLAGLPAIGVLAWYNRTARAPRRLLAATLLRAAAWVLLALALAQPVLLERSREISVVYAIDISKSISPAFLRQTMDWIREENKRHAPAQARYVVFANRARMFDSADDVLAVAVSADGGSVADAIDQSDTDLEQALRSSMLGFAPNSARRLVLVSDGNQTRGDVWRALSQLQAEHVRVFTVPAAVAVTNDAWVEAIVFPDDVRQQEPITASVNVFSRTRTHARVELSRGSRVLSARSVALEPGTNEVEFRVRILEAGTNVLTARVSADGDENGRNDALSETLQVGPRPRVLYVEGAPESAHYLADALRAQHIDVTVAQASALASEELAGHDVAILSDVPAAGIDAAAARTLESFVRDQGHGLIFAAGESTYGKQGYAASDVERLLPVRLEGKRKRRELDLVLLIDRSHSMRGRKLELAKTAALATLDLLEQQHRLAVVAFDSRPHEVVPLVEVGSKRRAEDLISSMSASGQTNIYNALVEAQRILTDSTAGTKHIILLSDGVTAGAAARSNSEEAQEAVRRARAETLRQTGASVPEPATEAPERAGGMSGVVAELTQAKVTLSTVAIGEKPNLELMKSLAAEGHGKAYVAASDAEIPGLFVSETRRLLGEAIVEEPFRPTVRNRARAIAGLDFADGPELKGFVVSRAKAFAEVLLQAPKQEPLLVQTHYGLGKTVAFLSDVKNRWAAQWLNWDGYGRFWAQLVRDTMARGAQEGISWQVRRNGSEAIIELSALDGKRMYRDDLAPRVRVTQPGGESAVLPLRQVGPGRYRASVPMQSGRSEPYRFEAMEGGGLRQRDLAQIGARMLAYPWSDEYRVLPPNNALLRALSEQTGGVFAPKADEIFAQRGDGGIATRPLWQWFAAAALVLFLLDILVRRAPRF
jgi:Mg-chelatase subunit ChlD